MNLGLASPLMTRIFKETPLKHNHCSDRVIGSTERSDAAALRNRVCFWGERHAMNAYFVDGRLVGVRCSDCELLPVILRFGMRGVSNGE